MNVPSTNRVTYHGKERRSTTLYNNTKDDFFYNVTTTSGPRRPTRRGRRRRGRHGNTLFYFRNDTPLPTTTRRRLRDAYGRRYYKRRRCRRRTRHRKYKDQSHSKYDFRYFNISRRTLPCRQDNATLRRNRITQGKLMRLLIIRIKTTSPSRLNANKIVTHPCNRQRQTINVTNFLYKEETNVGILLTMNVLNNVRRQFHHRVIYLNSNSTLYRQRRRVNTLVRTIRHNTFINNHMIQRRQMQMTIRHITHVTLRRGTQLAYGTRLYRRYVRVKHFNVTTNNRRRLTTIFRVNLRLHSLVRGTIDYGVQDKITSSRRVAILQSNTNRRVRQLNVSVLHLRHLNR